MAIGFKLIKDPLTTDAFQTFRTSGSQAYTIGDLVMADYTADGTDVVPATSSAKTTNILGVAVETIISSQTTLLVQLVNPFQTWIADVTNAPSTNDNIERMILTDKATVNNTHTDDTSVNAVFQQFGVVDTTGKRVSGRFLIANVAA